MAERMTVVAEGATRWAALHWSAATALSLFAVTGLVVLSARSRLTGSAWRVSAWAVLAVGALWTMTTAVAEATAVTGAAVAGNAEMFEAWWAFSEGKANGFAVLVLAVVLIAGNEARASNGRRPPGRRGSVSPWRPGPSLAGSWGRGSASAWAASSGCCVRW